MNPKSRMAYLLVFTSEGTTSHSGETTAKTDTTVPFWQETPLKGVKASELLSNTSIEIWDFDELNNDDFIGGCPVPLTQASFDGSLLEVQCPATASGLSGFCGVSRSARASRCLSNGGRGFSQSVGVGVLHHLDGLAVFALEPRLVEPVPVTWNEAALAACGVQSLRGDFGGRDFHRQCFDSYFDTCGSGEVRKASRLKRLAVLSGSDRTSAFSAPSAVDAGD